MRTTTTRGQHLRVVAAFGLCGALLAGLPAGAAAATDGPAFRTVRLSALPAGADPAQLTVAGSRLFFTATDPTHGRELWTSDGTAAGTRLVRDITPGRNGSQPAALSAAGSTLYFSAADPTHGRELWRSDGTTAGTTEVADSRPGPAGSAPGAVVGTAPGPLFFAAADGAHGRELWRTDGTAAGTTEVADIRPGPAGSAPTELTAVGQEAMFAADDGTRGRELWQSDGTAAGTTEIADLRPGATGSDPAELTAKTVGNTFVTLPTLVFTADDGTHGREAYGYQPPIGTLPAAGPTLCDLRPGAAGSAPASITPNLTRDYLSYLAADDGTTGREVHGLGCADTAPLADIRPGPAGSDPRQLTDLGPAGFGRPANDWPSGPVTVGLPGGETGQRIAASADDGTAGREPWVIERYYQLMGFGGVFTPVGADARRLADLRPGPGGSDPRGLTAVAGTLFFSADDGRHGRELWRSNGSAQLTALVADLRPGSAGADPRELTAGQQALYFTAADGTHGRQVYRTAAPVGSIVDLSLDSADPPGALPAGSPVPFSAQVNVGDPDGTPTGTVTVAVDGVPVTSAPLAGTDGFPGFATASVTVTLTPGRHLLTATYPGDGTFAPAFSLSDRVTAG